MRRNRKIRCISVGLAFLLVINCIVMFQGIKADAQSSPIFVTLPLEQVFLLDGNPVSDSGTTFQYELYPERAGSPMPTGTVGGIYTIAITGVDAVDTGWIEYGNTGIYGYTVKASLTNDTTGYIAEYEEYEVEVYVQTMPNGSLDATVIAKNQTGAKVSVLGFTYVVDSAGGGGSRPGTGDGTGTDGPGNGTGPGGPGNGNGTGPGGPGNGDGIGPGGPGNGDGIGPGDPGNGDGTGPGGTGTSADGGTGTSGAGIDGTSDGHGTGVNAKGNAANTGDIATVYIWWVLMLLACTVIMFLFRKKQ